MAIVSPRPWPWPAAVLAEASLGTGVGLEPGLGSGILPRSPRAERGARACIGSGIDVSVRMVELPATVVSVCVWGG